MVFADWTFSGDLGTTGTLDGVIKYAGNSSYKSHVACSGYQTKNSYLQHNTFLEPQAQIVMWCRYNRSSTSAAIIAMYALHSSYGSLKCNLSAYSTWEKHRLTFWYDITTNTRFGRDEKWNGSAWVQTAGDTNFGAGSPVSGSISLQGYGHAEFSDSKTFSHWFDEVEVSA